MPEGGFLVFASRVARSQTKTTEGATSGLTPKRATYVGHRFSNEPLEESVGESESVETAPPYVSWDFSKIPLLSRERASRVQTSFPAAETPIRDTIQTKLNVGPANDSLEQEADYVAEQVVHTHVPRLAITPALARLSLKCAACAEEERPQIQAKPAEAPAVDSLRAPGIVHAVLRTPGQPLDAAARTFFEPRFGRSFAAIRIHDDDVAGESARALDARAYASRNHIVFAPGQYVPGSVHGRLLLAHELAHTVQQDDGTLRRQPQSQAPPAERDALAAEISTLLHTPDPVGGMRTSEAIQRLQGLDWTQLVSVLRALRTRNAADPPIVQDQAPLLISVAAETVTLEATRPEPEVLARYRARVKLLPQPDQTAVIATYPAAAVPADPALPTGGLVPPPGAPTGIPAPLLETLYHSYARRQAGLPGSDQYLANAFWGGRPTDFWQALTNMGAALDVIRRVYTRWTATTVPWTFVDALYNTWSGTSDGFDFACQDRSGLEAALNGASKFCQDHVGGLYHWWVEGTTPCWREIIDGSPGLHVCTGGGRTTVHIDPHQVVSGTWPGGFCSYNISGSVVDHFKDLGWW